LTDQDFCSKCSIKHSELLWRIMSFLNEVIKCVDIPGHYRIYREKVNRILNDRRHQIYPLIAHSNWSSPRIKNIECMWLSDLYPLRTSELSFVFHLGKYFRSSWMNFMTDFEDHRILLRHHMLLALQISRVCHLKHNSTTIIYYSTTIKLEAGPPPCNGLFKPPSWHSSQGHPGC
jgi:hypothetical protein